MITLKKLAATLAVAGSALTADIALAQQTPTAGQIQQVQQYIGLAKARVQQARNIIQQNGRSEEGSTAASFSLVTAGSRLEQASLATINAMNFVFTNPNLATIYIGQACLQLGGARVSLVTAEAALNQPPFDGLEFMVRPLVQEGHGFVLEARGTAGCP